MLTVSGKTNWMVCVSLVQYFLILGEKGNQLKVGSITSVLEVFPQATADSLSSSIPDFSTGPLIFTQEKYSKYRWLSLRYWH